MKKKSENIFLQGKLCHLMQQPLDQYQHTSPTTAQVAHRPTLEGWRGEPPSCGPTHTSPLTEWQLDRRTPWVSSYCCGNQSRPGTFRGKATLPPLGPPALSRLMCLSTDRDGSTGSTCCLKKCIPEPHSVTLCLRTQDRWEKKTHIPNRPDTDNN